MRDQMNFMSAANQSIGSPLFRSFHSLHMGRSSRAAKPCVNFVNLVNYPTPPCECNVKNALKSAKNGKKSNLHYKVPTTYHSSQCSQCSQSHFLGDFLQKLELKFYIFILKNRFLCLFSEANEYICTYWKPKGFFCNGTCEHCELGVLLKFTQFMTRKGICYEFTGS